VPLIRWIPAVSGSGESLKLKNAALCRKPLRSSLRCFADCVGCLRLVIFKFKAETHFAKLHGGHSFSIRRVKKDLSLDLTRLDGTCEKLCFTYEASILPMRRLGGQNREMSVFWSPAEHSRCGEDTIGSN